MGEVFGVTQCDRVRDRVGSADPVDNHGKGPVGTQIGLVGTCVPKVTLREGCDFKVLPITRSSNQLRKKKTLLLAGSAFADGSGRMTEQARPEPREIEGEDAAEIDVLVADRRDALQNLVRIRARRLVDGEL